MSYLDYERSIGIERVFSEYHCTDHATITTLVRVLPHEYASRLVKVFGGVETLLGEGENNQAFIMTKELITARYTDPPLTVRENPRALIMGMMRRADNDTLELLQSIFPEIWEELQTRYNSPGGLLREERHEKLEKGLQELEDHP